MNPYPLTTVGGLIFASDGDILLVQSQKWIGCYSLPGGKVEKGETRQEAFIREIKEETGLDLIDCFFVMTQDSIFSSQFYKPNHFIMNDFIAKMAPHHRKEDVVLNDEAEKYLWVSPEKARQMSLNKEAYVLLDWFLAQCRMKIGVKNHKICCFIGDNPSEFEKPQDIFLDYTVEIAHPNVEDKLSDTVNYEQLASVALEIATQKHTRLLETLALKIVDQFLKIARVRKAKVVIKKPSALKGTEFTYVEYEKELDISHWRS